MKRILTCAAAAGLTCFWVHTLLRRQEEDRPFLRNTSVPLAATFTVPPDETPQTHHTTAKHEPHHEP